MSQFWLLCLFFMNDDLLLFSITRPYLPRHRFSMSIFSFFFASVQHLSLGEKDQSTISSLRTAPAKKIMQVTIPQPLTETRNEFCFAVSIDLFMTNGIIACCFDLFMRLRHWHALNIGIISACSLELKIKAVHFQQVSWLHCSRDV